MNKVFLIGNLTRDPELSETPNGKAVCRFTLAVGRNYGDSETDFFNVNVWREKAENCAKFLAKGKKVAVVGSLQNRSYEDKDGIKRTVTDVVASEVEFLTPKQAQEDEEVRTARMERPALEPVEDNQFPF